MYNTTDDPYTRVCVPNKVKNMNAKIFNLMSGIIEIIFIVQHELPDCKCGLNKSVCNSKQKWNPDECWCECKKLDDWTSCEKGYMWNPGTCDYECNKACKIYEYLDTKTCSCKKQFISKLVLEREN